MRSRFAVPATIVAAVSLFLAPAARAERLLVKVRAGADAAAVLRAHGATARKTIPGIGVRVVDAPSARAVRADPRVAFAERDTVALPQAQVPDDPFFPQGSQALGGGAWGWYRSHTTDAWDVTRGSFDVTVAVLDTGLKAGAQDFDGRLVAGWNVVTGTSDTSAGAGTHGTYVAGVVGLALGNGTGGAGYCPDCRIMPVQVGSDSGAYYGDMAAGITWAADHGARIINLSWAGTSAPASTLASAVSYARSKGAVVLAAAGNSNCDCPTYPSATPGVIGVAGVTSTGTKAGDSNFGSWVDVAAPEGNMSFWPMIGSGPGFTQFGGTSSAAPAAAGIAGLVLSAAPTLSADGLQRALESGASPTPFTTRAGEVDALAAVSAAGATPAPRTGLPVNTVAPRVLVGTNGNKNTAPLADAPQVGQLLVRGQGAWTGPSPLELTAVTWYRCAADGTSCTGLASTPTYTVQSADTGSALRFAVRFTSPAGSTMVLSPLTGPVGGAAAGSTSAPAGTAAPAITGTAQSGQTLSASAGSWSGSPTSYAYQWQRCDASGAGCAAISGATAAAYTAGMTDVGATLRVAVTATNAAGFATATSAATATVAAAPAAQKTSTFSGSLTAKATSQTYTVAAGAGRAKAALSFNTGRCGNLAVTLKTGGSALAAATGPSVLGLDQDVAAGTYAYVVSGSSKCSFTLSVTTAS